MASYSTKMHIIFVWMFLGAICCLMNCPLNSAFKVPCAGNSNTEQQSENTRTKVINGSPGEKLYKLDIKYTPQPSLDGGSEKINLIVCFEQNDNAELQEAFKKDGRVKLMKTTKKETVEPIIDPTIKVSNCFAPDAKPHLFQRVERLYKINEAVTEVKYPVGYPYIEFNVFNPRSSTFEFKVTSFIHGFGGQEVDVDPDVRIYNVGVDFVQGLFEGQSETHQLDFAQDQSMPASLYRAQPEYTNQAESATSQTSKPSMAKRILNKINKN